MRRAVSDLGLKDMVTLTLPPGARGSSPADSRIVAAALWHAFVMALRKWGRTHGIPLLEEYVAVPEAHQDGTCHLHAAADLEPLLIAEGWTGGENRRADAAALAAVQAFLSEAWGRLGGGFVDYRRGARGYGSGEAARYLAKYLGKTQAKAAPWSELRYCTTDAGFRRRPWHRYFASWNASAAIAKVRLGPDHYPGKEYGPSEWELARPEILPSGRIRGIPWNPAKGSAIVAECDGHPPTPEWVPGSCHHGGSAIGLGCFCVPSWAAEPVWSEPLLELVDVQDEAAFEARLARELAVELERFRRRFEPTEAEQEYANYARTRDLRGWAG